jgi:hypothetical protein
MLRSRRTVPTVAVLPGALAPALVVTAEPGEYVGFYDSQQGSFDPPGAIPVGESGTVTAEWTPQVPARTTCTP